MCQNYNIWFWPFKVDLELHFRVLCTIYKPDDKNQCILEHICTLDNMKTKFWRLLLSILFDVIFTYKCGLSNAYNTSPMLHKKSHNLTMT